MDNIIDSILRNLEIVKKTRDVYKRTNGYYSATYSAAIMAGYMIAEHMYQNPRNAEEILVKVRAANQDHLLKGLVLWAQNAGVGANPVCPEFFRLMNQDEKKYVLSVIFGMIDQELQLSPMVFEVLISLSNDHEMQTYARGKLDCLFETFDKTVNILNFLNDHDQLNEQFKSKFMRLFFFLKGHSISKHSTFFNYHRLSSSLDGLKVVYILRMLRAVGIANFREVWQEAMENKKIHDAWEIYARVRGLRRVSRILWKDFNHQANFVYYDWKQEFGDFNNISRGNYYYPPDKPCELLANNGQIAIIRMTGKRYVIFNHKNEMGLIFPCKSKSRDPLQILASILI